MSQQASVVLVNKMADTDTYPGVDTAEEEQRRQQLYPAVVMPTPTAAPAVAAPEMPKTEFPAISPKNPEVVPPPPPQWKDYAPAQSHGLAAVGHAIASINPAANEYFNVRPQREALQNYNAATGEYKQQLEGAQKAREEASKEQLEAAQAKEHEATAATKGKMVTVQGPNGPVEMPVAAWEKLEQEQMKQKGAGERTTQTNESRETIAGGREKLAEEMAKGRLASNERIATGHNLAMTESARIRSAAANDPNKLTNTMKSMKQQAQATLPGIERALDETEKVAGKLGPVEGRWNDFMTGKYGGGDPEYKHYRDEIGMVQSAVTLAHARGRMSNELFEHFNRMFDAGKLSPENMIQALNVAHEWLTDYANMGEPGSPVGNPNSTGGGGAPIELERGPDGKLRPKAAKK